MSISDISTRDDITNMIEYKISDIDEDYLSLPEFFTSVNSWDDSTLLKCWNHHDTFEGIPKFIPKKWNYVDDQLSIETFGCFCSWNCAKTFLLTTKCSEIPEYNKPHTLENLAKLAKLFNPEIKSINTMEPFYKQIEYSGIRI